MSRVQSWSCLVALAIASGAAPLAAASACYTEGCGTCDNSHTYTNVSQIIAALDFSGDAADSPIVFVDPGDGLPHRFLATQEGKIWVWDGKVGDPLTQFLDLTSTVVFGGERGLLSMAFDPDYATSGEFYVYYTRASGVTADNGDVVVARYHRSAGNPEAADTTGTVVLVADRSSTQANHNGGTLAFGHDGMLYVSIGDGGGGCDDDIPGSPNGQNKNVLLGKLLRIDVRAVDPGATAPECGASGSSYGVPTTNPLAGATAGCGEIWAYGLRNPFRFTVERTTGDFWIADVGQDTWEEINFLPASYSPADASDLRDFGWRCREGCESRTCDDTPTDCTEGVAGVSSCSYPMDFDPGAGQRLFYDPILCHNNPNGWQSIISGYRYHGAQVPSLVDTYLYADVACGQIWRTTSFDSGNPSATTAECFDSGRGNLYQFAQDHLGELYFVIGVGTGRGVYCVHNGGTLAAGGACYWAGWGGIFQDDFESNGTTHWSSAVP